MYNEHDSRKWAFFDNVSSTNAAALTDYVADNQSDYWRCFTIVLFT